MSWIGWQLDYLLLWQSFREHTDGVLDQFFIFISQLAIAPITFILLCIIYWSINKKLGIFMLYCSAFSLLTNIFLKFTFCIYRPWILDPRIQPPSGALGTATGYSFPSGHTSGAVSFWGALGMYFKNNKLVFWSCALLVFLVMVSRNYLDVHTPQDVIVSLIVGICILFLMQKVIKKTETEKRFGIIFLSVIAVLCIILIMYLMLKSYPLDYANGVLLYDNTGAKFDAISDIFKIFAIFLGCFLESKFIKFDPEKLSIIKRILIALIGLGILFLIDTYGNGIVNKFVQYHNSGMITSFLTGLFVTFIYPCFIKGISFLTEK